MSHNGAVREDSASQDPSPQDPSDDATTPASKRRRIAFSCRDCRRRKLKCDREYPSCGRCQKGGHANDCIYDTEAVDILNQPAINGLRNSRDYSNGGTVARLPSIARSFVADEKEEYPVTSKRPRQDTMSRLSAQEERIFQLENRIIGLEALASNSRSQWPISRSPILDRAEYKGGSEKRYELDHEAMIFRGKNFKTQFYGASNHSSNLSLLPELREFMKDMIVQHPTLAHAQRELRGMKVKGDGQDDMVPPDDHTLRSLLPQRQIVDQLVQIYVSTFETTHRILHLPSFWREYAQLWDAPHEARPGFIALVLLIISTTNSIRDSGSPTFRGDSSLERETAMMWVRKCDAWLQSQSQKHTDLTRFQLLCLSFLSKQINSVKRKRTWTSAGTLMRLAMSAGFHRDAEIVNIRHAGHGNGKKVSLFDQEIRRRLWTTISELELQAAQERGMPAMTRDLVEDCGLVMNIEDEDLEQGSEELPESKPLSQFTRSSYQHLSWSSRALRLELTSMINGPSRRVPYEDVLIYDKRIMQALDEIPFWNNSESEVARVLLQLQLQQLLLALHRPFARNRPGNSQYNYSAMIYLKSAELIIDLHDNVSRSSNQLLGLLRNDLLGAALAICYNFSLPDITIDRRSLSRSFTIQLSGEHIRDLEKVIQMFEKKIMCIGIGLQEYYCVFAVTGLLRQYLSPEHSTNEPLLVGDKVCCIIQKVLNLQDNYSAAATLASLPNMPISLNNGVPNGDGLSMDLSANKAAPLGDFGAELEEPDFSTLGGWDLDAFWNL